MCLTFPDEIADKKFVKQMHIFSRKFRLL